LSVVIAIDCGGSHTRAGLYDASRTLVGEAEGGPGNPVAGSLNGVVDQIVRLVTVLDAPEDAVVAVGVAGARNANAREAIWSAIANRLPGRRIVVTDDQTPVLLASHGIGGAILVTAGTGSCVLALDTINSVIRSGGRGPLLGDDGSAYAIAVDGLKRAARAVDGAAPATTLSERLPIAANVTAFDDLIDWQRDADKRQIAALAESVCLAAVEGDAIALQCLEDKAGLLATTVDAARLAAELDSDTTVFLNGGLMEHSVVYVDVFCRALSSRGFVSTPVLAPVRGHAAVRDVVACHIGNSCITDRVADALDSAIRLPTTEQKSDGPALDSLDAVGIVQRMIRTNDDVDAAMVGAANVIAEAVEHAASALGVGGRIIYAGAGTSGRLAVLDAAECRPTFGVEEGKVVALIAGGDRALVESVEEAEDSRDAGRGDLAALTPSVGGNDFVVGITASGTTPYACAVVEQAAEQGARTALLTCNAESPSVAPLMIRLVTGPEALPGSTRLKAGTATKLALNIISTGAFARAGHIYDGWMVGVRPINSKLRARAARIIGAIAGLDESSSRKLLEDAGNRIPVAVVMNRFQLSRDDAEARLEAVGDDLRAVLDA